ncbi:hypothetical protein D3C73_1081070 [compost metagenome]
MDQQRNGLIKGFNFRQMRGKYIGIPVGVVLPAFVEEACFFTQSIKVRIRLHIIFSMARPARIPARQILLHDDLPVHVLHTQKERGLLDDQPDGTGRKGQLTVILLHREQMRDTALSEHRSGRSQIRHLVPKHLHPEHFVIQKYKNYASALSPDNVNILGAFPGYEASWCVPSLFHNQRAHFFRTNCFTALHRLLSPFG